MNRALAKVCLCGLVLVLSVQPNTLLLAQKNFAKAEPRSMPGDPTSTNRFNRGFMGQLGWSTKNFGNYKGAPATWEDYPPADPRTVSQFIGAFVWVPMQNLFNYVSDFFGEQVYMSPLGPNETGRFLGELGYPSPTYSPAADFYGEQVYQSPQHSPHAGFYGEQVYQSPQHSPAPDFYGEHGFHSPTTSPMADFFGIDGFHSPTTSPMADFYGEHGYHSPTTSPMADFYGEHGYHSPQHSPMADFYGVHGFHSPTTSPMADFFGKQVYIHQKNPGMTASFVGVTAWKAKKHPEKNRDYKNGQRFWLFSWLSKQPSSLRTAKHMAKRSSSEKDTWEYLFKKREATPVSREASVDDNYAPADQGLPATPADQGAPPAAPADTTAAPKQP